MSIEDIIMLHGKRGMDILRPHLPDDFCIKAAKALLSLKRGNILLATGFYVAGFAETDGPPGTLFLAKTLSKLGFDCTIITDKFCKDFFESENIKVKYADISADKKYFRSLLDEYSPVALISLERCGINANGDYANMRGKSIAEFTAKIDLMFDEGNQRNIPTFGIGDGGNEIGMGNFRDIIERELSLVPCAVSVDYPIIATVSNWGGYGIIAALQMLSGIHLMPDYGEVDSYLKKIAALGAVDGVTKYHEPTVDGFSADIEREIIEKLSEFAKIQ